MRLLFILLIFVTAAHAQDPIQAELMHAASPAATIGVKFKIAPGWHLYWKYPGDSGLPTRIAFTPPSNVTVGPLRWPAPRAFQAGPNLIGYGYENEVVLSAPVSLPATGAEGAIALKVNWLGCSKDLCLPGRASLSLPLTALQAGQSSYDFSPWLTQVPTPSAPNLKSASLKRDRNKFTAALDWSITPFAVEWFPEPGKEVKIKNLSLQHSGQRSELSFELEAGANGSLPEQLPGVIAYAVPGAERQAAELILKLEQP